MSKLVFALLVTVLGLAVVFIVLILLTGLASLVKFSNLIPARKHKEKKKRKPKKPAPIIEEKQPAATEETLSLEVVAAISAAIASYMNCNTLEETGLRIRSIRKKPFKWALAGRTNKLNNGI